MDGQKPTEGKLGRTVVVSILIVVAVILGVAYWQLATGANPLKRKKTVVKGKQVKNPKRAKLEGEETTFPPSTYEEGTEQAKEYKAPIQLGSLNMPPPPQDVLVFDPKTGRTLNVYFNRAEVPGFHSVRIYRSTTAGVLGVLVYDNAGTSFSDRGLYTGATYYYTLRSVDIYGRETSNSNQYSGRPTDATPPSILSSTGDTQASSNSNKSIFAQVSDEGGIEAVVLYYKEVPSWVWNIPQPMSNPSGDGVYETTIPTKSTDIEYYIEARDYSSNAAYTNIYLIDLP